MNWHPPIRLLRLEKYCAESGTPLQNVQQVRRTYARWIVQGDHRWVSSFGSTRLG